MKPKIERNIEVKNGEVKIISTIDEQFTKEEFKQVIRNKREKVLAKLMNERAIYESQMKLKSAKESDDLQKTRRLFGRKLGDIVAEFMNNEVAKKSEEELGKVNNEIAIVEKDLTDFTAALSFMETEKGIE
jgi:ribosomal 30S subunit maturation factor RimM